MAYGPCGEQFRAAFSCFVFSKDEPKGVDCIEQFKMMQNCFREHPDVYGSELEDDEASSDANLETDDSPALIEAREPGDEGPAKSAEGPSSRGSPPGQGRTTQEPSSKPSAPIREEQPSPASSHVEMKQHPGADEADDKLIPKAWHDSRETATGK
jgi:intermembrane space import and assembly protein 40